MQYALVIIGIVMMGSEEATPADLWTAVAVNVAGLVLFAVGCYMLVREQQQPQ